jgi:ribonuclease BN (tRNA processing enzyme)
MTKITILGSGTCTSHFAPNVKLRHPPAFLIEYNGTSLLLDCSEGVRLRLESIGFDYSKVQHIALSHAHPDHCAIIHFIQSQFCKGLFGGDQFKNDILNFYCPNQIAHEFDSLWNFHQPDWRNDRYPFPALIFHPMTTDHKGIKSATFGHITLEGISVKHGRKDLVDALGFRIITADGTIAYSGDSRDCDGLRMISQNADIFICEATAGVGLEDFATTAGHLTPYQAGKIASETNVKKLVLVHYPGTDSVESMTENCLSSGFQGDIIIGDDFDVLKLARSE